LVLNPSFDLTYFAEKNNMRLHHTFLFLVLLIARVFVAQDKFKTSSDVLVRLYLNNKVLPDSIHNFRIVAGKKVELLTLSTREADLSTNNYRQVFRKTPGIFVSDHDPTGLQTSISTRGLSANRSWEFNMRQNGYDIAADPAGYPEAYFTPTLDAVASIEVYRGSSALQYGTQFGGMINYQLKDQLGERPISYEGSHTAGSFGLFNSFNAIGGKKGNWTYYGFMHHRQAEGFRANSRYFTNTYFGKIGYSWKKGKITAEYHNSYYLSQQPGGLHDTMYSTTPDSSLRSRNWFELPWKMASIQLKHTFNERVSLHASVNYLHGDRNSIGFMKGINIQDTFNLALGSYNKREIDRDIYNTLSSEIRSTFSYNLLDNKQVLAAGIRYCLSDIERLQKGIGTGGSDFDLTISRDNSGNFYQRDLDLQTANYALFAEQMINLGKRFTLVPGFRMENIEARMSGRSNQFSSGYMNPTSKNRMIFLGGISTKYTVIDKSAFGATLYANANQNYRPVMYSELLPSSTTEVVDSNMRDVNGYSSEFGIKGSSICHRWIFNYDLNAFYIRYNGKVGTLPYNGGTLKTNIGDLESKGIELYTEINLLNPFLKNSKQSEQLTFYFSGTLLDARYKRWENPSIAGNELTSVVGKKAEYAPDKIFRAGVEYKTGLISFNYQFQYTGSCFTDAANTQLPNATATVGFLPAYSLHDAGITLTLFENYQLKLGVNDLMNTISPTRRVGGYPGPGLFTNQARSFYTTLTIKI